MISLTTKVLLKKSMTVSDLAGEKVMVDFETGKYYLLKGSANDIWDLIQQETTAGAIKDALMEMYEVEEEECWKSILTFLEDLHQNGFISLA